MKRKSALAYLAALMAGVLGAVCVPASWYQNPAPKLAMVHSGSAAHSALLADRR